MCYIQSKSQERNKTFGQSNLHSLSSNVLCPSPPCKTPAKLPSVYLHYFSTLPEPQPVFCWASLSSQLLHQLFLLTQTSPALVLCDSSMWLIYFQFVFCCMFQSLFHTTLLAYTIFPNQYSQSDILFFPSTRIISHCPLHNFLLLTSAHFPVWNSMMLQDTQRYRL